MLCNQVQTEIERYTSIVETAAMQEAVISLDYTQAEPYLQKLMEQDKDMWSHLIIAKQNHKNFTSDCRLCNLCGMINMHK